MATWSDILGWQPGPTNTAVATVNAEITKLESASDELAKTADVNGWTGEAATAATAKITGLVDGTEELAAELGAARRALADVSDAITGLVHGRTEATELARLNHFTIAPDGAVIDTGLAPCAPGESPAAVARDRQAKAIELRDRVAEVIRQANDIDADACAVFRRIVAGSVADTRTNDNAQTNLAGFTGVGGTLGGLSILEPPPLDQATPAQNAAWWNTLSRAQKDRFLRDYPGQVGPRNGVSAVDRDTANRVLLGNELTRLHQERADLRHRIDTFARSGAGELKLNDRLEFERLEQRLNELDKKIGGAEALRQRLEQPPGTPEGQRYYLLGINGNDDGQAVLAKGNPDTARNVATYVPGTTSDLATFGDEVSRSDAMHNAAERAGSPSTSVVTYLGYDAPDALSNAVSDDYAESATGELREFQEGLRTSHDVPPSHNTVVGHSYGTTVLGYTARSGGINANDMILIASPGVGTGTAQGLGMPDGHVWATTAEKDIINSAAVHGPNPVGPEFGARVFAADPGTPGTLGGLGTAAHGEYWEVGNPSLDGIGRIISGMPPQ